MHKGQSNLIYPEDHQVDRDQVDRAQHRDNRSKQKHNPDNQAQDVQEQVEEEIPAGLKETQVPGKDDPDHRVDDEPDSHQDRDRVCPDLVIPQEEDPDQNVKDPR